MKSYTAKRNAIRAAKAAVAKAGCVDPMPGTDFKITEESDGRFSFTLALEWGGPAPVQDVMPGQTELDPLPLADALDKAEADQVPEDAAEAAADAPAEVDMAALTDGLDVDTLAANPAPGATVKPTKPKKLSARAAKAAADLEAAKAGEFLPVPQFAASAQAANVKRCGAMLASAQAGDFPAVRAMEITGKAHSADVARRYQAMLITAIEAREAQQQKAEG